MSLTLWIDGSEPVVLEPGQHLMCGRAPGPGELAADNTAVSREHVAIRAEADRWSISTVGRYAGVVVYDHETPSRIHVPRGVTDLPMPFASASVVIEIRQRRYPIRVEGTGAAGWSGAWRSIRDQEVAPAPNAATATETEWDEVRWQNRRNGRPLRWYQTLVAMCEPFFAQPPVEVVPSDAEIARRLGVSENMVQSNYIGQVRDALGFGSYSTQLRQTLVSVAISQRLVTVDDLRVLDEVPEPG